MFEFDKCEPGLSSEPPAEPAASYQPVDNIDRLAFMVWGEHCVECAAPACFTTCDLYQPRPDRRCRRFQSGQVKNSHFPSLRGCGAEVTFKKWAKLEARGNTRLESVAALLRKERRIAAVLPFLNHLGHFIHMIVRDQRWCHLTHTWLTRKARRLHQQTQVDRPDAFLLEAYNPAPLEVRLQLVMSVAKNEVDGDVSTLPTPFATTVALAPGYNRVEIERIRFRSIIESGLPFDVALIPEGDSVARLVFLSADFVTFQAGKRPDIKCVVFDLDNTLWKGVLLETPDVELRPGMADLVQALDARGILISIVSKNDHDHAWKKVEALGLADYFLHPQINWLPKSENLKTVADRLNIGIDTLAFIDDNPFELEEVGAVMPMVSCINVTATSDLLDRPRFQGSTSVEAKMRRQFYKDAIDRLEKQATFGDDYLGFLASCDIEVEITRHIEADLDRITELVQRTNQLNFSGRKYTREDVVARIEDDAFEKFVLRCKDRFGSYGTVGFCLVTRRPGEIHIDDFMLSCRVQGKFIEQAFFNHIMQSANPEGVTCLTVNFRRTDRNTPAWSVLTSLHFEVLVDGGMVLDTAKNALACDFITVI